MTDLTAECSQELRADIARRKAELLLEERDEALADYIAPCDWHQQPLMRAYLDCKCEWRCSGYQYGRPVDPRYVRQCETHLDAMELLGEIK